MWSQGDRLALEVSYAEFDSRALDQLAVAQLGSAPDLGSGGREFESHQPDHEKQRKRLGFSNIYSC